MTASGSYDLEKQHRDARTEIERLAAQAQLGWDKEARTLTWFGLKDGMSFVELGSGPGFITEKLLKILPSSHITCLEINPTLIEQAKQYLQTKADDRVHFKQGTVMEMEFAENSFEFAYARLLFQHLPDPLGAAKEIFRVLRPGGKLVIYDIDDDIFGLIDPPVPEFTQIMKKFGQAQAAQGGNRHIGRSLWRILKASGYDHLDLEVVTSHSDDIGIKPFLPQLDPDRMLPLLKMGVITDAEMDAVRAIQAKFLASPQPYILLVTLMVYGEKPQ